MKRVLLWSLAIVGIGAVALVAAGSILYASARTSNVGELSFVNELQIPTLLEPREQAGRKVFDMRLQRGTTEFVPGKQAETWGANGSYLGPTLRASRGDEVELRVRNALGETTTIHWHRHAFAGCGRRRPPPADRARHDMGTPLGDRPAGGHALVPPPPARGDRRPRLQGPGRNVHPGRPSRRRPSAPERLRRRRHPLIIEDKRLSDEGSLDFSQGLISPTGRLGDEILINGTHDPYLEVRDEGVRLRLLNASNARVYNIGFAGGRTFELVGTDGGLLKTPQRLDRVQLSPGERAEIVAFFAPGEQVVLRSFEPDLGSDFFENRFSGSDDSFDLLEIRASQRLAQSPQVPDRLAVDDGLSEEDAVRTRRFELSGSSQINGRRMDLARIDEVLPSARSRSGRCTTTPGGHTTSIRTVSASASSTAPAMPRHHT